MSNRRAVFIYSPELEEWHYPESCPFNSSRAGITREKVETMGLLSGPNRREEPPEKAGRDILELYHLPSYLDAIQKAEGGDLGIEELAMGLGTPDCPIFKGMYDYSSLAAGGTVTAARLLLDGSADVVFNPSGGYHHAGASRAAGFCYINDIVLAAMVLAEAGKRVLFLDIDVHHCDGVQEAFFARSDVMTISLHESGKTLFPGTGWSKEIGEGEGEGFTVNAPLPAGIYDEAYERIFREAALPLIRAYDADIIVIELGMDALSGDPLAHCRLTNNTHAAVLEQVLALEKPVLATGGGGYNVENTVRGWALMWSLMCGEQDEHLTAGMGGVMMETTDWFGGLRDRAVPPDSGSQAQVDAAVEAMIHDLRERLSPIHKIPEMP